MRILVTGFTANYGGVENFIMNYYRVMKQLDDSLIIDIISTAEQPAFQDEIEKMGGKVWRIPRARNKRKQTIKLKEIMNNEYYNIIWCNKCDLSDIVYLKIAYKYKIPVRIIHSHSSSNMYTGIRGIVVGILHHCNKRNVERYTTEFWSCSDYASEWMYLKKRVESKNYKFVPNAVDTNKFYYSNERREQYRNNFQISDKLVVGCVGTFAYAKNPHFVLEIFKEMYNLNKQVVMLWVGNGNLKEEIEKRIVDYGLESVVQLMGVRHDVSELMQSMDCLLLPSKFEGLPVVAIEAQAVGLHVFAAKEGISEQSKATECFHFLSLEMNAAEWARNILQANLEHKDTRSELIRNGFEMQEAGTKLYNQLKTLVDRIEKQ
ncbi:MAG: glycosyltransferase [Eubacteriales bacterium]